MDFERIRLTHNVSKMAAAEFWNFFRRNHLREVPLETGKFKTLETYQKAASTTIPKMYTTAVVVNENEKRQTVHDKVTVLPREKEGETLWWVKSYVPMAEVVQFHERCHTHPCNETQVILGTDGVAQSRSSNASLDVFTVEFVSCRTVYPIAVCKVFQNSATSKERSRKNVMVAKQLSLDILQEVAADLSRLGLRVTFFKCDAPKRAFIKNFQGHTSYFACEYCTLKAILYNEQQQSSKRGKQSKAKKTRKLVWPSREPGEPRTHEQTVRLAQQEDLPPSDKFGVKGESVLTKFEGVDIIRDVPVEAMHFMYLGVVRSIISLALGIAPKKSLYRVAPINERFMNESIVRVKLPTEMGRKTRPIDIGTWKASEYRQVF